MTNSTARYHTGRSMWPVLFCVCAAVTILGKSKPLPSRVAGHYFHSRFGQGHNQRPARRIIIQASNPEPCLFWEHQPSVGAYGESEREIIWALNLDVQCSHCWVCDWQRRRSKERPDEFLKNIKAKKKRQKQNVTFILNSLQRWQSVRVCCLANQSGSLNQ